MAAVFVRVNTNIISYYNYDVIMMYLIVYLIVSYACYLRFKGTDVVSRPVLLVHGTRGP